MKKYSGMYKTYFLLKDKAKAGTLAEELRKGFSSIQLDNKIKANINILSIHHLILVIQQVLIFLVIII